MVLPPSRLSGTVQAAIQTHFRGAVALSIGGKIRTANVIRAGAGHLRYTGREEDQVRQAAIAQWHIVDVAVGHFGAKRGRDGVQERRLRSDVDGLRRLPQLECEIEIRLLAHTQFHVGAYGGAKTRDLNSDRVPVGL